MWQRQIKKSSFRECVKALEAAIHHANTLVASLPRDMSGDSVKMKLSLSPFASLFLFLIEWMDCSCLDSLLSSLGLHILVYKVYGDGMETAPTVERMATIQQFYNVIYPMLKQLEENLVELMEDNLKNAQSSDLDEENIRVFTDTNPDRDDECGICMEIESKVALPVCGHSMCLGCFNNWYVKSRSCPFCRGSLMRVASGDLWVLTSSSDVVNAITLAKDNLRRFYLYIQGLPLAMADHNLLMYNYLI